MTDIVGIVSENPITQLVAVGGGFTYVARLIWPLASRLAAIEQALKDLPCRGAKEVGRCDVLGR